MNEPKRLLEDPSVSGGVANLLRAIPGPPPLHPEKLGMLASDLASAAAAPPAAAAAAHGLTASFLKVGALVASAGLVVWLVAGRAPTHEPAPVGSVAPPAAPVSPAAPPVQPSPVEGASPAPEAAPAAAGTPPPSRAKTPADRLAEEEALLEKARLAAASSPSSALALLRDYQRKFPGGQLRAEQMYLLVEVLERSGDAAGAERQARQLVERFPKSVYARRIRERRP